LAATEISKDSIPVDKYQRPLRDLRISVTDRCNFRCPYCMPAEIYGARYEFLPRADILTFEEIARFTRLFTNLGVTKVRLTGGEPLIRADVSDLIGMLNAIPGVQDLTLTTNGYLLEKFADQLVDAGLRRITVSLDSLDEDVYKQMNGRNFGTEHVLKGIAAAENAGLSPIKINAVVEKGINDHTLVDLAKHFKGTGHILRFIEFMDVGNLNGWNMDKVVPAQDIIDLIRAELPLEPVEPNYVGEVVRRWKYSDGGGEIGVITSVTEPFCGDCTRARLSTDGKLVTCLFAEDGIDLRGPMRAGATDEELLDLISGTWKSRTDRYSEERTAILNSGDERPAKKIEMYQIGG